MKDIEAFEKAVSALVRDALNDGLSGLDLRGVLKSEAGKLRVKAESAKAVEDVVGSGDGWKIDGSFGLCPICHKVDGWANAGKAHVLYCKEHKKTWCIGANIFSSWRDQTEDEQRKIWKEIGLDEFEDVEPYVVPPSFEHIEQDERECPF
jgi:hypothetical protein